MGIQLFFKSLIFRLAMQWSVGYQVFHKLKRVPNLLAFPIKIRCHRPSLILSPLLPRRGRVAWNRFDTYPFRPFSAQLQCMCVYTNKYTYLYISYVNITYICLVCNLMNINNYWLRSIINASPSMIILPFFDFSFSITISCNCLNVTLEYLSSGFDLLTEDKDWFLLNTTL